VIYMNQNYGNYGTYGNYGAHQIDPHAAKAGLVILGGFFLFFFLIFLAVYAYMAICLMKIAKKTNTDNAWLAWIPVGNLILLLQIAKKPIWWIILFFVPFVNLVMIILVWMAVAKELGKPDWLGILMIVPIANLIVPGYLAFSKTVSNSPPAQSIPSTPVT
jgi:hypothetical protein